MTKHKCWKRESPNSWISKDNSRQIRILESHGSGRYKIDFHGIISKDRFSPKDFPNKKDAEKFANKYMKENDKC